MSLSDNFFSNGGRIFRRRERNRTITVAYIRDENSVRYGATIHQQESPSDTFRRKPHNSTAIGRCMTAPVEVPNQVFEAPHQFEDYIRSRLITDGCWAGWDAAVSGE